MSFTEDLRAFEKKLQDNIHKVLCPVHLCLGQEAVPAALHECLMPEDWLYSYHRAHGHYMAKGGNMDALWDEIMGLDTGLNGGFSGSQEFSDPSVNFHCSAIVGGLVGVATGTALALKLARSNAVVVCVVGDAATEQGVFWESANFAALHKLPIAYIVENNGMADGSPIAERQATDLSKRADAFGLRAVRSVYKAVGAARHKVPTFHECKVKLQCDHLNMKGF